MKVKDIMVLNPITINKKAKLKDAVSFFLENNLDLIIVPNEKNEIIGIVTKELIVKAYHEKWQENSLIESIMIKDFATINEDDHAEKAWDKSIKTLPVVDKDKKVIGVLTGTALVRAYYRDLKQVKGLNNELNAIIESSYDGFYITDGKGITLRINSAYERITGIKPEDVIGRSMEELVEKGVYSKSVTLIVLKEKKPVTIMHDIKTGKRVMITGNPVFDEKGEIVKVVTNVRDITELLQLKSQLDETKKLTKRYSMELKELRSKNVKPENIILKSEEMKRIIETAFKVSDVETTVLITGESGVGKEIIAKTIHNSSPRKDEPFIKVNCSAIPETLLESELFGYEKGSFTGANQKGKMGMFELAQKGTIFLDEIGELPLKLQPKLLRVIQDKETIRIGGNKAVKLDVRIITATNRNLEEMTTIGKFREDLFYRLNVVPIKIPPLRERKEDITELIYNFLNRFNSKYNLNKKFSINVIEQMVNYSWPGNVRELENLVERLVVLVNEEIIEEYHLPSYIREQQNLKNREQTSDKIKPLKKAIESYEKAIIEKTLNTYGSTRKAAKALEVDQSTIVRKAQKYGIRITK